jgi:hypothetical protein
MQRYIVRDATDGKAIAYPSQSLQTKVNGNTNNQRKYASLIPKIFHLTWEGMKTKLI